MAGRGRPKGGGVDRRRAGDVAAVGAEAESSQALAQRCRIVLGCAAGKPNKEVAAEVGVWPQTVGIWRRRFVECRLGGLVDEPRPGGPRTITDERVEAVMVATLEREPKDATHWSRASMAAETGLSKSTVGRIWKAFGLKPHQIDTFKSATIRSSLTRCAMSSACISIRRNRRWCCVSMRRARSRPWIVRAGVADDARMPERRTHDYVRHGITTLFAALDVATGQITGRSTAGTAPPSSKIS